MTSAQSINNKPVLGALLWAVVLVVVVILAWLREPQLDSSILALLPKESRQPLQQQAIDQLGQEFSRRLLLLVQADSAEQGRHLATQLAQQLQHDPGIAELQWQITAQRLQQLSQFYQPWRYQVLAPALQQPLQQGQFHDVEQQALRRLLSPISGTAVDLIKDPFALLPALLDSYRNEQIAADHGLLRLVMADKPTYLLLATLSGDGFAMPLQQTLVPKLLQLQQHVREQGGQLYLSGMLMHAAAGAAQARGEISTIGLVSTLGIILLVLIAFRRWYMPLIVLLPVVVGCIFAVAVTALFFGRLHLITLAFGAGLVGVSVDYALHYLAAHGQPDERSVLRRILPGLLLGGGSSVLAYAAQALAPFPGLRQMACFAVAGLTGAWLSVVLWYPCLLATLPVSASPVAATVKRMVQRIPALPAGKASTLLGLLAVVAVALLASGQAKDDLRLLQTSPQRLLDQDIKVGKLLGQSSSTRFLLVMAPDNETLLQREEQLLVGLQTLQQRYPRLTFASLSHWVPSQRAQAANLQLVRRLYAEQAMLFFQQLSRPELANQANAALLGDGEAYLTVDAWLRSPLQAWAPGLWLQGESGQVAGVIRLAAAEEVDADALSSLASTVPDTQYVDHVRDISAVLNHYRQQISFWVAGAYLLVLLLLVWRYGRQSWLVVGPPLVAALLVAGVLSHMANGLNLFHLLALLLVLGLGLDMGIFLQEGESEAHVWLAVSLSMLTSLLAFGLLVLSTTPLLHDFGLTVLLGLGGIWMMSIVTRSTARDISVENRSLSLNENYERNR
ncbi:MMPL family transporter [Pokkaliibacter plantistimulans]|uniref:MMPL family transporter n=1 Tax=Pokkaliibacter plantistimulans TaxID=1635171 RepID=UPI000D750949|nr:MMPL family transporter [Pokkaliibacter plantistimulans]